MDSITTPEIFQEQTAAFQTLVWVYIVTLSVAGYMFRALWLSKKEDVDYIREQDKANLTMLMNILTHMKTIGADVSKIETALLSLKDIESNTNEYKPQLEAIRQELVEISRNLNKNE